MQTIIDKLEAEKRKATDTIKVNEDAIAQHESTVSSLSLENEVLEEELTAVDAAIAVLSGKKQRRRRKK